MTQFIPANNVLGKLKVAPLHCIFISIFPILALYIHNKIYISISTIYGILLLVSLSVLIGFTLLFLLTKKLAFTGLCISCFAVFFFSYTNFYETLSSFKSVNFLTHHSYLIALYTFLFSLLIYFIVKLGTATMQKITAILNLSSGSIFLVQLIQIVIFQANQPNAPFLKVKDEPQRENNAAVTPAAYPDIVYLILDGYGRQDVLHQNYNFNNADFINFLKEQNFYVAGKSTSNYVSTIVSISSSLNFDYLQNLINPKDLKEITPLQLSLLVENAQIIRFLKQKGYRIKSFTSGYTHIDIDSNAEVQNPSTLFSEFNSLVLQKTPFRIVDENSLLNRFFGQLKSHLGMEHDPYMRHRNNILAPVNRLPDIINQNYPSFVFADIIVGHPPFIFSETGAFTRPPYSFSFADGNHFYKYHQATRADYITGYKNQLTYINRLLQKMITTILANQNRPLVFIIQGDHGPGGNFHEDELAKTNVGERFSNLNAYYFSDKDTTLLYPNITPVNSFRVVLNKYFASDLPLLPDISYYSPSTEVGTFTPVSKQLKSYR